MNQLACKDNDKFLIKTFNKKIINTPSKYVEV
jgi:hypothetical protein